MIILIFIIRAKDFFHQSFHEIIGTSRKPDMIIVPANLTGSAILIRKRNNPCFFVHGRNRCHRKHMFQNHLFFQLIQFKILFCIMESRMRVRHSMNRDLPFFFCVLASHTKTDHEAYRLLLLSGHPDQKTYKYDN